MNARWRVVFPLALLVLAGCGGGDSGSNPPPPVATSAPTMTPTTTPTMTPTMTPTTTPTMTPTMMPTMTPIPTPTRAVQTGQACPGLVFNQATNEFEATLQYSAAGQQCGGVGPFVIKDGNGTFEPATVTITAFDSSRVAIFPALTGTTQTNSDPGTYFAFKSLASGNSTVSIVFQVMNTGGTMTTLNGKFTIQTNY